MTAEQTRQLLDSIDCSTVVGLRDRALLATMVYSFARVSAVSQMKVEDYYQDGARWWLRLHEKGGKEHAVPAHHNTVEYLHEYLRETGIQEEPRTPLFRAVDRRRGVAERGMARTDVLRMIKRRAKKAGLPPNDVLSYV